MEWLYFLSDLEHKLLTYKLLPAAREVGVSGALRGWSWHQAPLRPYYEDVKLPMYSVCSKYCPTGRDVYLSMVERVAGTLGFKIGLGKLLHGVVSDCLQSFIRRVNLDFDTWKQRIRWEEIPAKAEQVLGYARRVWNYLSKQCEASFEESATRQPYASEQDLVASTAPFLIEHKISGELLGLSGLLSLDCYDYLRAIMFDLKVASEPQDWHRLAPTGYALVFESVYEVPVDIGCVVYLNFKDDRIVICKDLFFINDELRQWWIEERDRKLEIVAEKRDPGAPSRSQCKEDCIYFQVCRG